MPIHPVAARIGPHAGISVIRTGPLRAQLAQHVCARFGARFGGALA